MTNKTFAKFYKSVSVETRDGGYAILLDGKPAKTPGRARLRLPTESLAEAVATEWREQGDRIDPAAMPLTRLANTAIDRLPAHCGAVIGHILGFGRSDLLCYRADSPAELASRQAQAWEPLLQWMQDAHGVPLRAGQGIAYIEQPAAVAIKLEALVAAYDDFRLTALDLAAGLTGSLVLALALVEGRLTAGEVFAAAHIDEIFQAEKWGRDEEAEARRARLLDELRRAGDFLGLLG